MSLNTGTKNVGSFIGISEFEQNLEEEKNSLLSVGILMKCSNLHSESVGKFIQSEQKARVAHQEKPTRTHRQI